MQALIKSDKSLDKSFDKIWKMVLKKFRKSQDNQQCVIIDPGSQVIQALSNAR